MLTCVQLRGGIASAGEGRVWSERGCTEFEGTASDWSTLDTIFSGNSRPYQRGERIYGDIIRSRSQLSCLEMPGLLTLRRGPQSPWSASGAAFETTPLTLMNILVVQ